MNTHHTIFKHCTYYFVWTPHNKSFLLLYTSKSFHFVHQQSMLWQLQPSAACLLYHSRTRVLPYPMLCHNLITLKLQKPPYLHSITKCFFSDDFCWLLQWSNKLLSVLQSGLTLKHICFKRVLWCLNYGRSVLELRCNIVLWMQQPCAAACKRSLVQICGRQRMLL